MQKIVTPSPEDHVCLSCPYCPYRTMKETILQKIATGKYSDRMPFYVFYGGKTERYNR
jgi:hypothetical protein